MPSAEVTSAVPLPFNLTDLDREILSQTDDEYVPHSWEELQQLISANDLHLFKRTPSSLRAYLSWSTAIKAKYGSMVNYVSQERLQWGPATSPSSITPRNPENFADESDYKILLNDWPYGCDPGICHLVVWMKTKLPVNPADGSLVDESRKMIEGFVERVFGQPLERAGGLRQGDRVLWFKNWTALQSVAALEHFHVLVRSVEEGQLVAWTGEKEGKRAEV